MIDINASGNQFICLSLSDKVWNSNENSSSTEKTFKATCMKDKIYSIESPKTAKRLIRISLSRNQKHQKGSYLWKISQQPLMYQSGILQVIDLIIVGALEPTTEPAVCFFQRKKDEYNDK